MGFDSIMGLPKRVSHWQNAQKETWSDIPAA